MSLSYYDRSAQTHLDGSLVFANKQDAESENEVAATVERIWSCTLRRFGELSPIDWYAERHGRVVGLIELKTRPHESTKYPSVWLNVRKWLALTLGSAGMGVPSIFIARFNDRIAWCPVNKIDASQMRIGGCARIVKSRSDTEPVIDVPISMLRQLNDEHEVAERRAD